ncbi:50S ribosomal protein L6 [Candidatus Giovannonibacteria bacterium]|nr:50S ribosomal protein L6 [Candidatus Giovannonibacteria bacterium]
MSRIGKKPIAIPSGVSVAIDGSRVTVKGPKGELSRDFRDEIKMVEENKTLQLSIAKETRLARALWGTYASHLKNMILGVTEGYTKRLELQGIGYKAQLEGKDLLLSLGFSHPVKFPAPLGISFNVEKNFIVVSGIDKEKVGMTAAEIRELKKPEPYKGKGIRYDGEVVRRKAGKKAASVG